MELIDGGFLKTLRVLTKSLDFYKVPPFLHKTNKDNFSVKSQNKIKFRYVLLSYMFLWFSVSTIQTLFNWKLISGPIWAFCVLIVCTGIAACAPCFVEINNCTEIVYLLNQMVKFERRYQYGLRQSTPQANSKSGIFLKLICAAFKYCPHFHATLLFLNLLIFPCMPAYPAYLIVPQCRQILGFTQLKTWTLDELFSRILVAFLGSSCGVILGSLCTSFCLVTTIQAFCIRSYIKSSQQLILTASTNLKLKYFSSMQREIQIMTFIFRTIYSDKALPQFATGMMMCQVMSTYSGIQMFRNSSGTLEFYLICLWYTVNLIIVNFSLFQNLGRIWSTSQDLLKSVPKNGFGMKSKWFTKFYKSCPELKIYLGYSNYLEPKTPVVMQELVVDQTISLLLLE